MLEWCSDYFDEFKIGGVAVDPTGPISGKEHVMRAYNNIHGKLDRDHPKTLFLKGFIRLVIKAKDAPSRARKIVKRGDVLYATVRPYLHNLCIIDRDFDKEPIASTGFAVLSCIKGVYNKFLFYYLLSPIFHAYANDGDNAKGMAYPAINDKKLYNGLVPIPPLAEQKRIVEKIEQLMNEIDKLKL